MKAEVDASCADVDNSRVELFSLPQIKVEQSDPIQQTRKKTICPYECKKMLTQRSIEHHRMNGCPGEDVLSRKIFYCCAYCPENFAATDKFFKHLSNEHAVNVTIHRLDFADWNEFQRFVKWLEAKGGAHFRCTSGFKLRKTKKTFHMACNRSGGWQNDPPLRSNYLRTGKSCSAYIRGSVDTETDEVSIRFCGDHYGHDVRLRLPNVIRQMIGSMLLAGNSYPYIIRYLNEHFKALADAGDLYAQRVCQVTDDELRTLYSTYIKKWADTGIPTNIEIWEEEFLDRAGIMREGIPRLRELTEQSTDELNWPVPVIYEPTITIGDVSVKIAINRKDHLYAKKRPEMDNNPNIISLLKDHLCGISDVNKHSVNKENETPKEVDIQEKVHVKSDLINGILAEIEKLGVIVKEKSDMVPGQFLAAFSTRICQLRRTFRSGYAIHKDLNQVQPLARYSKPAKKDEEAIERYIGSIGVDDEKIEGLAAEVVKNIGEDAKYKKVFWN